MGALLQNPQILAALQSHAAGGQAQGQMMNQAMGQPMAHPAGQQAQLAAGPGQQMAMRPMPGQQMQMGGAPPQPGSPMQFAQQRPMGPPGVPSQFAGGLGQYGPSGYGKAR